MNETAPGALTAYVLVALLEGGLAEPKVVESALNCIAAQKNPSPHNLAVSAYAAALAGHSSAKDYVDKLEAVATHKGTLQGTDSTRLHNDQRRRMPATPWFVLSLILSRVKKKDRDLYKTECQFSMRRTCAYNLKRYHAAVLNQRLAVALIHGRHSKTS